MWIKLFLSKWKSQIIFLQIPKYLGICFVRWCKAFTYTHLNVNLTFKSTEELCFVKKEYSNVFPFRLLKDMSLTLLIHKSIVCCDENKSLAFYNPQKNVHALFIQISVDSPVPVTPYRHFVEHSTPKPSITRRQHIDRPGLGAVRRTTKRFAK